MRAEWTPYHRTGAAPERAAPASSAPIVAAPLIGVATAAFLISQRWWMLGIIALAAFLFAVARPDTRAVAACPAAAALGVAALMAPALAAGEDAGHTLAWGAASLAIVAPLAAAGAALGMGARRLRSAGRR